MKVRNHLAILRNLRNIYETEVSEEHQKKLFAAFKDPSWGKSKVLPFRFIAAARAVPQWEPMIDQAMQVATHGLDKLSGKTVLLVDVSGSMDMRLSQKSDLTNMDAAAALAVLVAGIAEQFDVLTFSNRVVNVPPRQGMALRDAVIHSQDHGGTYLGEAIKVVDQNFSYDRLIVITDEQSHDVVPNPEGRGYMVNVASNRNGVGYGMWTHIDGFSEAVINYITELEKSYIDTEVSMD